MAQWFWRRGLLNFINVFRNYLPLEISRALHSNKLEFPSPKNAMCQVRLKLAQWFWKSRFFNFFIVLSLFCNYLPLEIGRALHSNKFESPSPKDATCMCHVWLKLAQWFWRWRFLNFVNIFSQFCNYLPLKKGRALNLKKLESPSPKDALCQVWLKLAEWFWWRSLNFVNVF